jgi:hypothetical protein
MSKAKVLLLRVTEMKHRKDRKDRKDMLDSVDNNMYMLALQDKFVASELGKKA